MLTHDLISRNKIVEEFSSHLRTLGLVNANQQNQNGNICLRKVMYFFSFQDILRPEDSFGTSFEEILHPLKDG